MPLLSAIIAILSLVLVPVLTPFAAKRSRVATLEMRMALLGAVAYLTFCYFLGNGLTGALQALAAGLFPHANATLVLAAAYALVTAILLPVACYAVAKLFCSSAPSPDEAFSIGYGMALAQIVITLLSPIVTYTAVVWNRSWGTLEAWVSQLMEGAPADQIAGLVSFYEALSPLYGVFLAAAVISVMALQLMVAFDCSEAILDAERGAAWRIAGAILLFSFLYQFVPTLPSAGYAVASALGIAFSVVALRRSACIVSGSSGRDRAS